VGETPPADLGDDRPGATVNNGDVTQSGGWIEPSLAEYRRVTATQYWPYLCAAVLCLTAMVEIAASASHRPDSTPYVLLFALPVTLPVALARVQPVVAAALLGMATPLLMLTNVRPPLAGFIALTAAYYLAGRHGSRRAVVALGVLLGLSALVSTTTDTVSGRVVILAMLLLAGAAAVAGANMQATATATSRQVSDLAIADTLLEHAARGERARIARELHDVVAHHISMISAQAEAARLMTAGMPPDGATRLVAIGETARSALTEMRRLLGVLREDAGDEGTRRPQPGLQQLNELLDQARGLSAASTRLIVHGRIAALDPGIELTAYRIVQEALTNARRHAPGAAVDVELDYRLDALHLRVRDNGPGLTDHALPTGHGLTGMRERAATVGGRLAAGPTTSGGFLIEAVLPTSGEMT
jgi:signal transduction histidine kinase